MDYVTFEDGICRLSRKIGESGYEPDMIIGILRGGAIPARYLSTALDVKKMSAIEVVKDGEGRRVVAAPTYDLDGLEILLVEDMLESGKSLDVGEKYLESKGAIVTTACFYIMPQTVIKPDFYLEEIEDVVNFPWENILCS
ncbi:MAG: hypothetical protein KAJ20_00405 [Candidatus Aenigmarchaeota archaeon]|nr:hypothetical protein [Candidatus Aenigmarchaeota archaeon]MCK5372780.1 hypothetical protein [Candidatus Aenigmarchaeota archaeon]